MAGNQPSNIEPYLQPGNVTTRNPLEAKATEQLHLHRHDNDSSSTGAGTGTGTGTGIGTGTTAATGQSQPQDGIPTSRGRGVHGSEPVDELEARNTHVGRPQDQLENENVNAEQMATLGEGKVADAVDRKSGTQQVPGQGPAEEQDFASDLDRKKAEQASARQEIKTAKQGGVDVDGGAGHTRGLGSESLTDA
ncbi:unnamed protein product [Discula destructiva]